MADFLKKKWKWVDLRSYAEGINRFNVGQKSMWLGVLGSLVDSIRTCHVMRLKYINIRHWYWLSKLLNIKARRYNNKMCSTPPSAPLYNSDIGSLSTHASEFKSLPPTPIRISVRYILIKILRIIYSSSYAMLTCHGSRIWEKTDENWNLHHKTYEIFLVSLCEVNFIPFRAFFSSSTLLLAGSIENRAIRVFFSQEIYLNSSDD